MHSMRSARNKKLKKLCALFSGGKDSNYALHWAVLKGFDLRCLISLQPRSEESWMFHYPTVDLTRLQAKALSLPIIFKPTSGRKGEELGDLEKALEEAKHKFDIYGIVTGALLSDYQRMNINIVAHRLGLKVFSPLWRKNQEDYMRSLVRQGFKYIITSISVFGLSGTFLGKIVDAEMTEEIIRRARLYGFNPAFEGGEAETLVVDAPLYEKRLRVEGRVVREGEFRWRFEVERAWLEDK